MQKIQIYLRLDGVIGLPVDSYGQPAHTLASITRGMQAELVLTLLDANGDDYELPDYVAWDFVLAHDWDTDTPPQLRVSEGIVAEGNNVIIPLEHINTLELIDQLGKSESVTLGAELCGFSAGVSTPDFVCQFQVVVRNRRSDAGTGTPTDVYDGQYTAAQIDALLSAKADIEDLIEIEVGAVYSAGAGIDISNDTIAIDTTNATEGQVIKRTANGVAWGDVASDIDVDDELGIDRTDGVETKVLSQKGSFVDLPEVDIDDELGINRVSGSEDKVLSEKGNFVNLPSGGSGGGTVYSAGDGIDISNDTIAIDTTNATEGQVLRKTSSGVEWDDEIDVDNELSINRISGSTSKVLSEKGNFVDLPSEIDVIDEIGIDKTSGSDNKYLSEKGNFVNLPNEIDVDEKLGINRISGSTSKVISEKGTFVDLSEVDVDDELSIDRASGSVSKVLSQKGTFVDLPDIVEEIGINKTSGNEDKYLSEKGTFIDLPEVDVASELNIDKSGGDIQKYLSEKGTFESLPSVGDSGSGVRHQVLARPHYVSALHLLVQVATELDFSDAVTVINTEASTSSRSKVIGYNGYIMVECPSNGFGGSFGGNTVIIDLSGVDTPCLLRYKWIAASGGSDWYVTMFPSAGEVYTPKTVN